jgi:hypothetical protein
MTPNRDGSGILRALLIGVDRYLPNRLPDGIYYPNLGGCVRDISRVEEFLRRKLRLADEQLIKLTASNSGGAEPPEPRTAWPTYENMVAAFHRVAEQARAGDQVYIHYSGHGGRAKTAYPELKGTDGKDETLVPTDIGNTETRYLRDVELAHLLKSMVDKGLIVTVVLDSCHSGGATRGRGSAFKRGTGQVDMADRPTDSLVAPAAELAATWREQARAATRDVKVGSGWLLEPRGYVLLAACRETESAYEYEYTARERSGALTYWLLDSLKQLGPRLTYKLVHDRLLAKIHGQFEDQTPQLEGEGNRVVFGSAEVQPQYAANLLRTEQDGQRILLNAGQAQGVRKGAVFAVYPGGTLDFTQVDCRLALVEIEQLGATDSWAKVTKRLRPETIEQGAQAVLLDPGSVRLRRTVRLFQREDLLAAIDQTMALRAVERAMAATQDGFIQLAAEGDPADFQVVANENGEYELWDAAGVEIANLRPSLRIDDSAAPGRLVQRLTHLAKYRNVKELDNNDPLSPLAGKLVVELARVQDDFDPADKPEPRPFDDPGGTPTVQPGEWIVLRVRNMSPKTLNVTVLDLTPSWAIGQIYPAGADAFQPLDPGASRELMLPLQASLPAGYEHGTDVLKVVATLATTGFRMLELPSLDQPVTPKRATRGGPLDPLEELMAAVAGEAPRTRDLTPAAYPSKEWITAQVEVRVKRS